MRRLTAAMPNAFPSSIESPIRGRKGLDSLRSRGLSTTCPKPEIRGTVLPSAGDTLTVTLYLEDGGAPLCLTDATVSWIKGSVFAIRFPKLSDSERKRLQTVIWKHVTLTHAKTYRTAFRIVS